VVVIAGEVGIGKSRLLRAFRERLRGEPCPPTGRRPNCAPTSTGWSKPS
jgi:Mg-chelatase subunit ChlI